MSRRNDLDICADILKTAKTGAKKTRIVYNANLNFKIIEKYLRKLIENGLLQQAEDQNFLTTQKGVQFLHRYRDLMLPSLNEERFREVIM